MKEPALDAARRRKGTLFLGLATGAIGFSMMLQMGLNENFLVGDMKLDYFHKGLLEAIRESCGILAVLILAMIAGLTEPVIAACMLTVVGVGIAAWCGVSTFFWLAAFSVVWSQGLHIWMPLPNSMVLAMAEPGKAGQRLGQLQSCGAIGAALALAVALGLRYAPEWFGLPPVAIRPMYVVGGAVAVLGAYFCLRIPRDIRAPGQPLVFRRKYWLYYLMCFLEGWRKQIFLAFAGFYLVKEFKLSVETMLWLWAAIQVVSWLAAQHVGRLVDRIGERKVLMLYYASVTAVFCGYVFVRDIRVLSVLLVIDNTFFLLAMALTTYVRRIAPVEEHTATLSMGVAMNHVAAVMMPLLGGWLAWRLGYKATFAAGIIAAVLSIFVAAMIPKRQSLGSRA